MKSLEPWCTNKKCTKFFEKVHSSKRGSVIGRCSKNDTHMRSVHVQRHDTAYRRLFFEVQKCVTCLIFEHVFIS